MAIKNFFDGGKQINDNSGDPLNGGKCYFYEPGTTTPKNTYTTSGLTVANANPVVLDSAGRANVWLDGNYRVIVKTSADVTIYDEDNINPAGTSTIRAISSPTTLGVAHKGDWIEVSGTTTLTLTSAATLGAGWYVKIRNVGSAIVTIARANTGNAIDGVAANFTLRPGVSLEIIVNNAADGFYTISPSLPMTNSVVKEIKSADIASASTVDLSTATGNFVTVTHSSGTTAITALGTVQEGTLMEIHFSISGGSLSITHNGTSLICPGAANITLANGDIIRARSLGSGNWRIMSYMIAAHAALQQKTGLVLLASGSASSQATLDLVLTSYTAWPNKLIVIDSLRPATDGARLFMRVSTDGGSNYDASAGDYSWSIMANHSTTTSNPESDGSNADTEISLTPGADGAGAGNAATESISGYINCWGMTSTTQHALFSFQMTYLDATATPVLLTVSGSGARLDPQDIDGIRILFDGGNIAAGNYRVYGYN